MTSTVRDICTFAVLCSVTRPFIPPVAVYAQVCSSLLIVLRVLPLFGLVQASFSDWLNSLDHQK